MLTHHVALVSNVRSIKPRELMRVSAALQKQATRDLGPIWGISATVDSFARLKDVPVGYWPIIVMADVQGAAGVHEDNNGQPFALVEYGDSWTLTASHECLEMLVDPFGKELRAGPTIASAAQASVQKKSTSKKSPRQGRVQYLVEVCDPSESEQYAYTSNDVLVSDFYTPAYFDPRASAGVRYSFTGALTAPRQVLPGGYLSWYVPETGHWWQAEYYSAPNAPGPRIKDLGKLTGSNNLRALVNSQTPGWRDLSTLPSNNAAMLMTQRVRTRCASATDARAYRLDAQIEELVAMARRSSGKTRRLR